MSGCEHVPPSEPRFYDSCPHCGYCSPNIADAELAKSPDYKAHADALAEALEIFSLSDEFWEMLCEGKGDLAQVYGHYVKDFRKARAALTAYREVEK